MFLSMFDVMNWVNDGLLFVLCLLLWWSLCELRSITHAVWAVVSQLKSERRELRSASPVTGSESPSQHGPADVGVHLSAFGR
jgi:hypothetical protein